MRRALLGLCCCASNAKVSDEIDEESAVGQQARRAEREAALREAAAMKSLSNKLTASASAATGSSAADLAPPVQEPAPPAPTVTDEGDGHAADETTATATIATIPMYVHASARLIMCVMAWPMCYQCADSSSFRSLLTGPQGTCGATWIACAQSTKGT